MWEWYRSNEGLNGNNKIGINETLLQASIQYEAAVN